MKRIIKIPFNTNVDIGIIVLLTLYNKFGRERKKKKSNLNIHNVIASYDKDDDGVWFLKSNILMSFIFSGM